MSAVRSAVGPHPLGLAVRRHALAWLVAANAAGVLLSLLLLFPGLGALLPELGYGRWMPVHMDGQLYGWCALPMVGLLFAWYLPAAEAGGRMLQHGRVALTAWSLALGLGCLSWLLGVSSGKLFMDWAGWARPLMPLAMLVLWVVLANAEEARGSGAVLAWPRRLLLALLLVVPFAFYWAASPDVFPSVNPDSGGATGASLLGSTLGIIVIYGAAPWMLGVETQKPKRAGALFVSALVLCCTALGLADHGNASHHEMAQIVVLGSLLLFVPVFFFYFRAFHWPAGARPWLSAAGLWWSLLLLTGMLAFLPGYSEHTKFTHLLVAHAHLALAVFVTSANWVVLVCLEPTKAPGLLGFWLWQLGMGLHLVVLVALGLVENWRPSEMFLGGAWTQGLFLVRLGLGLLLLGVSGFWFVSSLRKTTTVVASQ